jgi:hypothetical protein
MDLCKNIDKLFNVESERYPLFHQILSYAYFLLKLETFEEFKKKTSANNILVKSGMIFHLQLKVHIKMKFNICFGWVFYKTIDRIGEL